MTVHARLKNEFMEDEKYHNLMTWLKCAGSSELSLVAYVISTIISWAGSNMLRNTNVVKSKNINLKGLNASLHKGKVLIKDLLLWKVWIIHAYYSVLGFTGPVLPPISLGDTCGNIEKHCPTLPNWVKGAAKLLNTGEESRDWQGLAKELGRNNE